MIITRRNALALAVGSLLPCELLTVSGSDVDPGTIDWAAEIRKATADWPDTFTHGPVGELAQDLAWWELHKVQEQFPDTWQRHRYADVIPFNHRRGQSPPDAVSLFFGVGTPAQVQADLQATWAACEQSGVVDIALAFGDEDRSWTMLVAANHDQALRTATGWWGPQRGERKS